MSDSASAPTPAVPAPADATPAAVAAPDATPVERPHGRQDRLKAAIAAGKAAVAAMRPAAPAADTAPAADPADAADPAATPAPADAATPTAAAEPDPPAEDKPAKVWAELKRAKAEIARRERDIRRREDEHTKARADFGTAQAQLADLNALMKSDPKEFVKRLGGGSLRSVLEAAVSEQVVPPEQAALAAMQAKLDATTARLEAREKAEAEAREAAERKAAQDGTVATHQERMARLDGMLDSLIDGRAYPHADRQDRAYLVRDIYGRILRAWDDGRGIERTIPEVLGEVEGELARRSAARGSGRATDPPARAAGAGQTAKPDPSVPPTLTGTAAAARATPPVPLTGKARRQHFARQLRRIGE